MFSLSQTTGYAILALSCLDRCGQGLMLAKDVAACTGIPLPYLSKILNALGRSGLIEAKRGYRGGFALNRSPRDVSFHDVAVAIEGEGYLPQCMLGFVDGEHCPDPDGGMFWKRERERIERYLHKQRLADVQRSRRELKACPCPPGQTCGHSEADTSKRTTRTRHRSRL